MERTKPKVTLGHIKSIWRLGSLNQEEEKPKATNSLPSSRNISTQTENFDSLIKVAKLEEQVRVLQLENDILKNAKTSNNPDVVHHKFVYLTPQATSETPKNPEKSDYSCKGNCSSWTYDNVTKSNKCIDIRRYPSYKYDDEMYQNQVFVATSKTPQTVKSGCGCKGNCSSQQCGCVKKNNKCSLSCKCDDEICQNQIFVATLKTPQTVKSGCGCKGNCSSQQCGCVKKNNKCSLSCKCDDEICQNQIFVATLKTPQTVKSGCGCKGNCSSQRCGCVKNSNKCNSFCKCDVEICQN